MRAKPLQSLNRSTVNDRAGMWQGRDRAALPPALAPPQLQLCSQQNQDKHGTEAPMLLNTVTTPPESICRSRSTSVMKMTLLTTPIISNDFSV